MVSQFDDVSVTQGRQSPSLTATIGDPSSAVMGSEGAATGEYMLDHKLGAGGMGEVYAAHHVSSLEQVALKFLSGSLPRQVYRFKREFRAIADLSHPNLVRLHELTVPERGRPFFTMELVEGLHFVEWVRAGVPTGRLPDIARLEHALRQLVSGVHYLHLHDFVHRDLKPSNVLVDRSGRVVILDFGLLSERAELDRGVTRTGQMLGTLAYMSPEQARAEPAGPASDYWAIGAILYECLCGRPAHEGGFAEVFAAKQRSVDTTLDLRDAPEHLRHLCARLLSPQPENRPKWPELQARLQLSAMPSARQDPLFVGRGAELQQLAEALTEVRDTHEPVVVHLRGISGCGKTALATQLRARVDKREIEIFHGRCRERETVAYKGVDAIIDALFVQLRKLDEQTLAALQPRHTDALCQLFPILTELWPAGHRPTVDPVSARGLCWAALRELLLALSQTRPLLIEIDDFQWADGDSVELLHALLRSPGPPAILLLLCYRSDLGETPALVELAANEVLAGPDARVVELGPLPDAEARQLAGSLMRTQATARGLEFNDKWADSVALRSGGSPFFIRQMLLADHRSSDDSDPDLDKVLTRRLTSLSPAARRLLDLVACFGGPRPASLASQLCPEVSDETFAELVAHDLLVESAGAREQPAALDRLVETTHDRIREFVLAQLDPRERARLHREIGEALLAKLGDEPSHDEIFAIVDQLDAGTSIDTIDEFDPTERLRLARLNHRAGRLALEATAWALSRHYFSMAYALIEPWLSDAQAGGGELELCVEIAFGRARAEDMCETGRSDACYSELLSWALPPKYLGQIALTYIQTMAEDARWDECMTVGLAVLDRLEFKLPRSPGWGRALLDLRRGQKAAAKLDVDRLVEMPEAADEHARAVMNVLTAIASPALSTNPPLALSIVGRQVELLEKHGYHEWCEHGLTSLAALSALVGDPKLPASLCDNVFTMIERRPGRTTAWMPCWISAYSLVYPRVRPLRALATGVDEAHRLACDFGQPRFAAWIANMGVWLHFDAGTPLPELLSLLQGFADRAQTEEASEPTRMIALATRFARVLVDGGDVRELVREEDLADVTGPQRGWLAIRQLLLAVLFGEHEVAWRVLADIRDHHASTYRGVWTQPEYAVLCAMVLRDRWPQTSWLDRQRQRRLVARHRRAIRGYVDGCADNFAPLEALHEAEASAIDGRFELAMEHYERARTLAQAQQTHWVAGLASQRLAELAAARGHTIVAEAADAKAKAAFTAWGAMALVRPSR